MRVAELVQGVGVIGFLVTDLDFGIGQMMARMEDGQNRWGEKWYSRPVRLRKMSSLLLTFLFSHSTSAHALQSISRSGTLTANHRAIAPLRPDSLFFSFPFSCITVMRHATTFMIVFGNRSRLRCILGDNHVAGCLWSETAQDGSRWPSSWLNAWLNMVDYGYYGWRIRRLAGATSAGRKERGVNPIYS